MQQHENPPNMIETITKFPAVTAPIKEYEVGDWMMVRSHHAATSVSHWIRPGHIQSSRQCHRWTGPSYLVATKINPVSYTAMINGTSRTAHPRP